MFDLEKNNKNKKQTIMNRLNLFTNEFHGLTLSRCPLGKCFFRAGHLNKEIKKNALLSYISTLEISKREKYTPSASCIS